MTVTSQRQYLMKQAGTRTGNGSALMEGLADGRSKAARRWREHYAALVSQTTRDGRRPLLAADELLVRRAATLLLWLERADAAQINGNEISATDYTGATNTLRRICYDLGIVEKL